MCVCTNTRDIISRALFFSHFSLSPFLSISFIFSFLSQSLATPWNYVQFLKWREFKGIFLSYFVLSERRLESSTKKSYMACYKRVENNEENEKLFQLNSVESHDVTSYRKICCCWYFALCCCSTANAQSVANGGASEKKNEVNRTENIPYEVQRVTARTLIYTTASQLLNRINVTKEAEIFKQMVIKSSQTNNFEETIAFEWFAIIYPFAVQLCLVAVTNFTLGHSTFSKQHISVDRFRWEICEIFFGCF